MTLLVKICGLTTPPTLQAALEAGADMVGLVFFAKSPRHLSLDAAAGLAAQVRGRARIVALTVDADDATIEAIAETGPARPVPAPRPREPCPGGRRPRPLRLCR